MILTHLSLTNFRNFSRLDVDVPPKALMLLGSNAQGKTSLLEAIYYLATLTAFHAESDRELINFLTAQENLAVARIVADYQRGGRKHRLEVRIIKDNGDYGSEGRTRKEVLLDGVKHKLNEIYGKFNAVLFLPQMLSVIEGSPDIRRHYLNLTLSQVLPDYAVHQSTYTRAITQRNALLKLLGEGKGDPAQLFFWDGKTADSGAQLILARIQAVQALERLASHIHAELTRGAEILRLDYRPSYDPLPQPEKQFMLPLDTPVDRSGFSVEQIRQGFIQRLSQIRAEEIRRGVTSIGPHRDDLRILANGVDLGKYGSRGQNRTAMLALKLAEVAWMREYSGECPVLLLDEVLAELDNERRSDLLTRLLESEQTLLTTTDLNLFTKQFMSQSKMWQVEAGRVLTRA
ncbi:MAG: DNA replication/repair protein RecF [Chloroflexota bacterium]